MSLRRLNLLVVVVVVVEALSSEICAVAPVLDFSAFRVVDLPLQIGFTVGITIRLVIIFVIRQVMIPILDTNSGIEIICKTMKPSTAIHPGRHVGQTHIWELCGWSHLDLAHSHFNTNETSCLCIFQPEHV